MSAGEEGLHSERAVANGQSAALASHPDNDEENEGDHNEEEEEEEEEEETEGQAGAAGTPTGAPSASASASNRSRVPKKASLNGIPFPFARVKRLIKTEDTRAGVEATYVIAKGAGLFLEKFVEHSFDQMINNRKHMLSYKELATHVRQSKRFHFLADFVPEKVTAASALSYRLMEED